MAVKSLGNERSARRQMAVNMLSGVCVFTLNLCVSFFLTPFIVEKIGTDAYGYIGLSNNIIGYSSLLTIAVNSMAGRFITVKVHEGESEDANKYMSSIFYINLLLSAIILLALAVVTAFLPDLINIPEALVGDVQALFAMLGVSSVLGLMTGVISVGAFIRNRLDITNIRNVVGSFIRVILMLLLFGLFVPHLWYIGLTVIVMDVYIIGSNYYFYRLLTPELHVKWKYFDFKYVKEVTAAGAWNLISRLSEMLSRGFDLLLANLFINANAMGILSITQIIPMMILGFFSMLSGNFAPEFTRLYAIKDFNGLKAELLRAVRVTGFFSCIPLSLLFAYGDMFFKLWLPTEDAALLYRLSCLGSLGMIFAIPQEPLWAIFTITNKVKKSSINLFLNSIAIFATVLLIMLVCTDDITKLFVLASVRTFYGSIRVTTFLPIYGAVCLGLSKWCFFPVIIKNAINIGVVTAASILFKIFFLDVSWIGILAGCVFTTAIGIGVSTVVLLTHSDRKYLVTRIKDRIG